MERGYDAATVVSAIALISPSQVAGRIVVLVFARQSIRAVASGAVLRFPGALLLLWLLPPGFASMAVFAGGLRSGERDNDHRARPCYAGNADP